ncbi:hypothetical protein ACE193_00600 [Bernardetia sp. OM2101]|uniref:hypothetical protein n=1 Tax=Bernardetia sp. OM2101 TaxID=3344876 RepID=UPI0035D05E46
MLDKKNNELFSYKPKNSNQKIWQVYPDPKSQFIVLEIRQEKKSELVILDTQKKEVLALAEMEATQTVVNFFDKTILLSEIDFQNEMPLAKGLQALNIDFETIWQLEEVNYYGITEEESETQSDVKVIFSLQSNYYSVPLRPKTEPNNEEIEAKEENYSNLKFKVNQYIYSTQEYLTSHINYNDISKFIFNKINHNAKESIFYTENDDYLICSYLIENEKQQNENYLFCTDKKGNLKSHFLIKILKQENTKNPQELILIENKILWVDEKEFHFLVI